MYILCVQYLIAYNQNYDAKPLPHREKQKNLIFINKKKKRPRNSSVWIKAKKRSPLKMKSTNSLMFKKS